MSFSFLKNAHVYFDPKLDEMSELSYPFNKSHTKVTYLKFDPCIFVRVSLLIYTPYFIIQLKQQESMTRQREEELQAARKEIDSLTTKVNS